MTQSRDEEWRTITKNDKKRIARCRRKESNGANTNWQTYHGTVAPDSSPMKSSELETLVSACRLDLLSTKFYAQLQDALLRGPPPSSIVCYGIGNFGRKHSTPSAPLWQLACAMEMREILWRSQELSMPMYYFEPFMTSEEEAFLSQSSIQIITENERARRIAKNPTLFFMPHCPLGLYANLLFANSDCLENVKIMGNSLHTYADRLEQNKYTALLRHLQPMWDEIQIDLSKTDASSVPGYFEQAFNDSAVISFPGIHSIPEFPRALMDALVEATDDEAGELL